MGISLDDLEPMFGDQERERLLGIRWPLRVQLIGTVRAHAAP
jgi:hypothetical protein